MHIICKIVGHKFTKRIESFNFFFADNLWCCRCETWSYDFPSEWFNRWGNGIVPNLKGWLRGEVWLPVHSYIRWLIHLIRPGDLPF